MLKKIDRYGSYFIIKTIRFHLDKTLCPTGMISGSLAECCFLSGQPFCYLGDGDRVMLPMEALSSTAL